MSVDSKMTALADLIRGLRGVSGKMGLDAMAGHLQDEQDGLDSALAALAEKGVIVPAGTKVDDLAALIAAIEAGGARVSTGTFTPTSTITSKDVTHNLGVVPNLVAVAMLVEDGGYSYGDTNYEMISGLAIDSIQSYITYGSGAGRMYTVRYNRLVTSSSKHEGFAYNATAEKITLSNKSSYGKYVSGKTYMWIVAAEG